MFRPSTCSGTLALLADPIFRGDHEIPDGHRVGLMIDHDADPFGTHRAVRLAQVHEEERKPCAFFIGWRRRSASQEQHEIRLLDPRGPVLLAVDHVEVSVPDRFRADLRRVGAGPAR